MRKNVRVTVVVRCDKCGYVWNYGGLMVYATCPSCRRLNKIREVEKVKE